MRKATGKVVSLVLALALVITSFSATFASAATKTESGKVSLSASAENIVLANTNGKDDATAAQKTFDLSAHLAGEATIETYDHIEIPAEDVEISQITVSGDNIVRLTKDDETYKLTVRDAKGSGTATLNILFTGESNRGDDEITVRGTAKLTVTLLDAKTPILVPSATVPGEGASVDSFSGLKKNYDAAKVTVDEEKVNATTAKAILVMPEVSADSAEVTYDRLNLVEKNDEKEGYVEGTYVVSGTGTRNYVDVQTNTITYGVTDPAVGNTIRLSVYSTKENTDGSFDTDKTVAQTTVKVENKLVGDFDSIDVGDASQQKVNGNTETSLLSKSKTYAYDSTAKMYWDATGAVVDSTKAVSILAGRVDDVISDSTVSVNDGTVGDITASGNVTISGGSVASVDANTNNVDVEGGVVGSVSDTGTLTVSAGKVSGAVSATDVVLSPLNDEEPVSVGAVSAATLEIDGTLAQATAASYFATKEDGSKLTLKGEKASVGAIDFDYRNGVLSLEGFVGSVPAPTKGNFTGYEKTGATITTDAEGETKATVNGNLSIYNLELISGAVTFTGNLKVANLGGSEADLIINAGDLYISDTVATSNTLKLANAADVKPGTVVFSATADIADVDSFVRYGYELESKTSGSNDVFVISGVEFSGLTLSQTSVNLVKGESVVITASVYPNGTTMPEGTKVEFYLNGDLNYMEGANIGNNQAEVKAIDYNADFDVLNKGTLTAVVLDEYDIQLEEYGEAVCDITIVETKAPTETYKSDTTGDVVVPSGNTYQFKITSLNGQAPSVVLGSDGVFELVGTAQEGNDYFFKFQAVGASGAATGVYVNGDAKVATMYVDGNTGYTCDTTTVNVPAGGTYQVKITAASMPTLLPGNSIYTVAFASQEGNDYFFKITATSAQAGDVVGFYINGGARAFVATTV